MVYFFQFNHHKEAFLMKKFLSLLLALALALGTFSALADALPAQNAALPEVGSVVHGFEVQEIRAFPLVGAQVVLFEHQKTGAKLTYVANSDKNRAFQLCFATRPIDHTGLPHVFEHATILGSEKYPSEDLVFNLIYQAYVTYMNAHTVNAMTWYPIASLSEAQLLKLADLYVDSCFHPLILTNENVFHTEAWRYNMASMEDDLTIEGTVYTEMQGSFTLAREAQLNANQATFPGSALSMDQGGEPDHIPEMTYENLKNFHSLFYHPSNCMAYLYGSFDDYEAFLALLDEAFSAFEKSDFHYEQSDYVRITEPVVSSVPYAMPEGTDTANQSYIYYYIVCPGLRDDPEQEHMMDHLCMLLNDGASPLMQNLEKALPYGQFSVRREVAAPDDAILFLAGNVNEDDAALFKETVDASLQELAQAGFGQDMVEGIMTALSISTKLAPESGDPVNGVLTSLAYNYMVTGNPFVYLDYIDSLENIDEENRNGQFKAAIVQWLLDPALYTLTTTYPAPGQKEIHDAELAARLAEIKAQMTEEEKQAIIDMTNAEPKQDDNTEMLAQLKAVTVESLPEEVRVYPISDETGEDGVRRVEATAGVDGIGETALYLDAAAMSQEDIHGMRLFTRLLGNLDTDTHTKEELDVLTGRYLYNKTIGISVFNLPDGSIHPYLVLDWFALDEDWAKGYELMEELMFHTQFTDTQKLLDRVQAQKAAVRSTISGSAYNIMIYRGLAVEHPFFRYICYMNYLDYYAFLEELETLLTEDPQAVTARFESIQAFFNNNAGAISTFAGNEESIAVNRPLADAFLAKLDHQDREPAVYDLPVPSKREALIVDTNIQYNFVIASLKDLGLEENDLSLIPISSLVSDRILMPVLRDQMGVYSPESQYYTDYGMYLLAYRDPNLADTFAFFETLPEKVAELDVDQDALDGYIMNAYSGLAKEDGELSGAVNALNRVLVGIAQDEKLTYMKQLKAVTPEAVKAAADLYRLAWENGVHSTAGSAAAINANADLFDVILNPFNAKDTSQVELTDAPEGSEYYEAVRYVYENGLMDAQDDSAFGVEAPATYGDFLAAIYAGVGGPAHDPEGAREWLAGYEMVDPNQDLSAGLTEECLCFVLQNGFGVGISTDEPENVMTRGELADLLMSLFSE